MNLWQDFLVNDKRVIQKWTHYFPIYERHFAPWRNRSLTFLEIGVSRGGSLQMWKRYFGPLAKIVGIDIKERCKQYEEPGIFVRIGDQSDSRFLQSLIDEFGVPDIVLDDGSHFMEHVNKTFDFFYPRMHKNAVYMVEDLHTAYWPEFGGDPQNPKTFVNRCKGFIDSLNADHSRGVVKVDIITRQTFGISFYDSVAVFEKGELFHKENMKTGHRSTVKKMGDRFKNLTKKK